MVVSTLAWPKQLLHRPDVVATLEQMRSEGMPQRVVAHVLGDPADEAYRY